ncbi:hypothetical protein D3C77_441130 [compost metagenome]
MFMLFALLIACSNTANQQSEDNPESETASQQQAKNEAQKQNEQNDQTGLQKQDASSEDATESSLLNESEQQIYDALVQKLDKEKLVGLEPLSVAKLYVQASLDGQHDLQYFLYTTRDGHVQWSKEDHDLDLEKQGNRNTEEELENSKRVFQDIEKGTFIKTSDYEGWIKYRVNNQDEKDYAGFQMVQDEDGIWKVAFMPIQ